MKDSELAAAQQRLARSNAAATQVETTRATAPRQKPRSRPRLAVAALACSCSACSRGCSRVVARRRRRRAASTTPKRSPPAFRPLADAVARDAETRRAGRPTPTFAEAAVARQPPRRTGPPRPRRSAPPDLARRCGRCRRPARRSPTRQTRAAQQLGTGARLPRPRRPSSARQLLREVLDRPRSAAREQAARMLREL